MANKARPERVSGDFDFRRVRSALAEQFITQKQLAASAQLSASWINQVLAGRRPPGRLARIEIERGLAKLGLDPAAVLSDGPVHASPTETQSRA